jgi:hypothetical protein
MRWLVPVIEEIGYLSGESRHILPTLLQFTEILQDQSGGIERIANLRKSLIPLYLRMG